MRPRRWVGAALVLVLVLTLAPASTYSGGAGWGNPFAGLGSWFAGIRDLVTGHDEPVRHGVARPGGAWSPPGRTVTAAARQPVRPAGKRVRELTDRRTATATVYRLADGRLQTELSSAPVRYRDASGTWHGIDTRIAPLAGPAGGFVYGNDGTGFSTRFGDRSDVLVQVRLGDRWVRVGVAGPARSMAPTVKGSTVRYAGVWPGADLVYQVTPTGLKESIVLSGRPANDASFGFTVRTAGLDTRSMPDGSVGFFATGGRSTAPVFAVPKPFMLDARSDTASPYWHAYSDAVAMVLGGKGSARTVTITPDRGWLAAKDRKYPVVLDPTITVQPDVSTSKDAMIVSYAGTSNFGTDPRLGVGVDHFGPVRSLVQFDLAGVVPAGTTVDSADLSLYWDNTVLSGTTGAPVGLEARAVTQTWSASSVTWSSINAAVGDLAGTATYDPALTNTSTAFPVTGVVRDWVAGTQPNNGFMLKAADEATVAGGPIFAAGEFPVAPAGEWPTFSTRTAPKLTLTFGLPGVVVADPQTVRATGAELTWSVYQDPSTVSGDDLVEYQVHRSTQPDFAVSAATLVAPVPAGATSYTDTTATPDTTVYYRVLVLVLRKDGQLALSQAVAVKTPPAGYVDANLPTVSDTTITACDFTAPHDQLLGRPLVGVGYVPGGFGITRGLMRWDTSSIPPSARITQAEARLWRTLYNGNAAFFAAHALTRDFDEATATWLQASAGVPWTNIGGDAVATPIEVLGLVPTANSVWVNFDLIGQVQAWQADPLSNHGILLRQTKEPNKACPGNGEGGVFVSDEGAEGSVRPRLHVRYTDTTTTYYSAATPPRLNPGETVTIPVTVTNTTSQTWPAASTKLGYWWQRPDGSDATTPGSQLLTALPTDLAPGQVVTVGAQVKAPALSGNGNKAEAFSLAWDLLDTTTNEWKSASGHLPQLPQQIRVEDPTSDQLGLEKFYAYTAVNTGAGSSTTVNMYSGNLSWSYNALANPSRGPQTFVRMTYNSLDTSAAAMGFGWSLQTSTLQRLGSQLSFHPPGQKWPQQVRMVDGDGTTSVWQLDTHGLDVKDCAPSTCDYTHPHGVHLYLQQTGSADPTRAWVFTRPDRTQFFFDDEGFQSAIVDKNGNTMSFVYERRRSNNKPTKFLQRIVDATGRHTLTFDYYAKGDDYTYIDDNTWQEVNDTSLTNPFIIDQLRSITDVSGRRIAFTYTLKGLMAKMVDGDGSAQPKVFRFQYDATQGNNNVKMIRATDPRGATEAGRHSTDFEYFSRPEDDPPFKWWAKSITDRLDHATTFAYTDPDGPQGGTLTATATDALQHTTAYCQSPGTVESPTNS